MPSLEVVLIGILVLLLVLCLWFLHMRLQTELEEHNHHELPPMRPIIHTMTLALRQDNIDLPPAEIIFPVRRPPRVQKRRPKVKEEAKSYYTKLEKHDNNPQNTHDHQVLKYLKRKWRRILQLAPKLEVDPNLGLTRYQFRRLQVDTVFMEVRRELESYCQRRKEQYLAKNEPDKSMLFHDCVEMVLKEIYKGQTIISISYNNKPVREDVVLTEVWRRIHHPDNKANCATMVVSLLDQLFSCTERRTTAINELVRLVVPEVHIEEHIPENENADNYHILCINGRVDRMISCLTLQDADPILAEPEKDSSELANEAYLKAYNILEKMQGEWQSPEGARPFKEIMDTPDNKLTLAEKKIIDDYRVAVKKQIENVLKKDYKDLTDPEELNKIIIKAQAGVDT